MLRRAATCQITFDHHAPDAFRHRYSRHRHPPCSPRRATACRPGWHQPRWLPCLPRCAPDLTRHPRHRSPIRSGWARPPCHTSPANAPVSRAPSCRGRTARESCRRSTSSGSGASRRSVDRRCHGGRAAMPSASVRSSGFW